jgi:hypothetical protein
LSLESNPNSISIQIQHQPQNKLTPVPVQIRQSTESESIDISMLGSSKVKAGSNPEMREGEEEIRCLPLRQAAEALGP